MKSMGFWVFPVLFTSLAVILVADEPAKRTFESMQLELEPSEVVTYKEIGDLELKLHLFHPAGFKVGDRRPAYVAIHGGGWVSGTPRRFYPYANSLVSEGFVGISVEYRLANGGNTVFDCVKDGRAAIRYIRGHAGELGVDPNKITVAGGSAGAHVAAGAALFDGFDHPDEDLTISCRPDALVLLFGVLDTSSKGYGNAKVGKDWQKISPLHQVRPGMPPTILFHGDMDNVASPEILTAFCKKLEENKVPYELVMEKGGKHGHINQSMKLFDDAKERTFDFLKKHKLTSGDR